MLVENLIYRGIPIIDFIRLKNEYSEYKVIIVMNDYYAEAKWLSEYHVSVIGYYDIIQEKVLPWKKLVGKI